MSGTYLYQSHFSNSFESCAYSTIKSPMLFDPCGYAIYHCIHVYVLFMLKLFFMDIKYDM